jgi:hypothetical protein
MEVEDIVLSERMKTQKDKYYRLPLICKSFCKSGPECRIVVTRGGEGRKGKERGCI